MGGHLLNFQSRWLLREVSFDWVRVGCGVLLIVSLFHFFRSGEVDLSGEPTRVLGPSLFLLLLSRLCTLPPKGRVNRQLSGNETWSSPSKVVGLGEGDQPGKLLPARSRMTPGGGCVMCRGLFRARPCSVRNYRVVGVCGGAVCVVSVKCPVSRPLMAASW